MYNQGHRVLRLFGIDIYLHYSWLFIFVLVAYSLSTSYFPQYYGGFSSIGYWALGLGAALLLFFSVLLHELSHSLVAKHRHLKVERIMLFFFGGVASIPQEDVEPSTEFWMALAGPLFSLVFGALLYLVHGFSSSVVIIALTGYLWQLNIGVAIFNLVPPYPLDGGRVFRALLMFCYNDIRKATRIASKGGQLFGGLLMFFGVLMLSGNVITGLWFMFIGGFIWYIAKMSYENVVIKSILGHVPVKKLMEKKPVALKPVDHYSDIVALYKKTEHTTFLVENAKGFIGVVDMDKMPRVGMEDWGKLPVLPLLIPAAKVPKVSLKENTYTALRKLEESDFSLIPVVESAKVVGVVTRRKILHYLGLELKYKMKG